MDSNRKLSPFFNKNSQEIRLRGQPKNRWWKWLQTDINKCKITNWKERPKNRADWGKVHYGGEGPYWTVVQSKEKKRSKVSC
jgi:hypothetical protein